MTTPHETPALDDDTLDDLYLSFNEVAHRSAPLDHREGMRRVAELLYSQLTAPLRAEIADWKAAAETEAAEADALRARLAKVDPEPVGRRYYRPVEVIAMTGLGKTTVYEAIYKGELRAFLRGRAWLIPVEAVTEWIEGDGAAQEGQGDD